MDGRNPAPVDRWFVHVFSQLFFRVSTILLVVQDFFHPASADDSSAKNVDNLPDMGYQLVLLAGMISDLTREDAQTRGTEGWEISEASGGFLK